MDVPLITRACGTGLNAPPSYKTNETGGWAELPTRYRARTGHWKQAMCEATNLSEELPTGWARREAVVNGVRLHYVEAGAGPLMVLLHGFPEYWYSWRRQIGILIAAGFRVLAPTSRLQPLGQAARGTRLSGRELLRRTWPASFAMRENPAATVIGHDWGGVSPGCCPFITRNLVRNRVILNAPHPAALRRELHRGFDQLRALVHLLLPTSLAAGSLDVRGDFALLQRMLTRSPLPGRLERSTYRAIGKHRLNRGCYRGDQLVLCGLSPPPPPDEDAPCAIPTLLFWASATPFSPRLPKG